MIHTEPPLPAVKKGTGTPAALSPPTPAPGLDAVWKDLPPLPTPVPFSQVSEPSVEDQDKEVRMLPGVQPEGRVLELPDAVWGAGYRNGLPDLVDAPYPEGEYAKTRSFAPVLHIHDPSELPPFLESGQTAVFHLPPLPPDVYVLHVFTTGDDTEGERLPSYVSREIALERNLCIRWNDRRVWQRFHSPYADHIRVVLDPTLLHAQKNLITIENRGKHTVPLDALRITPLRPDPQPIFVALEEGQWLPTKEALWVRTVMVDVPNLTLPGTDFPEWSFPQRKSPKTVQEAQSAWTQVESRYRELEDMNHPHLPVLRQWIAPLRKALERGMMPVVTVDPRRSLYQRDTRAACFLFGDVIGAWNLRHRGDPYGIRAQMRALIDSPVFLDGRDNTTPELPDFNAIRSDNLYMLTPDLGLKIREFFQGKTDWFDVERFWDASFLLYPRANHQFKAERWALVGEWLFRNAAELLMTTRKSVFLMQGFPGGPYFPEGSGRPTPIWHLVRPLFRFGGVSSFPTLANIVPENPDSLMLAVFWQVADNGKDRVEVLASVPYMKGQPATLELPLPWSGPTQVLQHQVIHDWRSTDFPEAHTQTRSVEAQSIPSGEGHAFKGWLRFTFNAQCVMLFEFTPENSPAEPIQRKQISYTGPVIPETRQLFQVTESPPPSWWSRSKLNQNQSWAWNTAGPVSFELKAPTRPGSFPEWEPLKGFHPQIPGKAEGAMPLSETSTTIHFLDNPEQRAQMVRMEMAFNTLPRSRAVGMWVRAHPPPGTAPQPKGIYNRPRTRFWIGNHEERQLIEIPYNSWCFLSGSAEFWQYHQPTGIPKQRKGVVFWPDTELDIQPILEINSFDAYQVHLRRGLKNTDKKCLGFIREREDGTLALLVVGLPEQRAFWRQRLKRYLGSNAMAHVVDPELLVSAPSPEDPPPEQVDFRMSVKTDAKLLEVDIPKMPGPPSELYQQMILEDFPLIGRHLKSGEISAVLFRETREGVQ